MSEQSFIFFTTINKHLLKFMVKYFVAHLLIANCNTMNEIIDENYSNINSKIIIISLTDVLS